MPSTSEEVPKMGSFQHFHGCDSAGADGHRSCSSCCCCCCCGGGGGGGLFWYHLSGFSEL